MTNLKDIQKTTQVHPLIAILPAYLKDPANYEKIQKVIFESFAGKHSHEEVIDWASCADCQKRFANRSFVLKKLGFKNPAQYMIWKKIHEHIKARVKLR